MEEALILDGGVKYTKQQHKQTNVFTSGLLELILNTAATHVSSVLINKDPAAPKFCRQQTTCCIFSEMLVDP